MNTQVLMTAAALIDSHTYDEMCPQCMNEADQVHPPIDNIMYSNSEK